MVTGRRICAATSDPPVGLIVGHERSAARLMGTIVTVDGLCTSLRAFERFATSATRTTIVEIYAIDGFDGLAAVVEEMPPRD